MKAISVFGTSSDSGKSTISLALCKIMQNSGYKVAPFKAQNMSNNACVCDDGGEIGVAQYTHAKALGLETSYLFNPILLKPQSDAKSQVIVNGKVAFTKNARDYFKEIDNLKKAVDSALETLSQTYELLICEGAGSPVELNLMQKDLSNIYTTTKLNSKIILVADIERGGVFASIYGTYNLLPQHLKSSIIGVIINKFRGDISLFEDGVKIIEEQFGIKVLGVVPYINTQIGIEDSLSLNSYTKNKNAKIKIAVIKLPKISNFNDFEALIADKFVELSFIDIVCDFNTFDIIIIPGSKATITDLRWLKATGIFDAIKESSSFIFGVCGGYQMMFENIYDTDAIECNSSDSEAGFRLIDDDIVFKKQKTVQKKEYNINGARLFGYEIHCGVSKKYPIYFSGANFFGTHLHAIFENDNFRTKLLQKFCKDYIPYSFAEFRENSIKNLVETVSKNIDIDYILKAIDE